MPVAFGKILILFGALLVLAGVLVVFGDRIPFLGRLPGDIVIRGERTTFYFPLATCLLISLVLSLLFFLFRR